MALSYNFTSKKFHFCHVLGISALNLVPLWLACLKTSWSAEFGPLNTRESDFFSPKCAFSEMDHHTVLKLVQLQLACLKISGCTEFGPLNTMESDVLAKMCFLTNIIIIQLWLIQHAWTEWDHDEKAISSEVTSTHSPTYNSVFRWQWCWKWRLQWGEWKWKTLLILTLF